MDVTKTEEAALAEFMEYFRKNYPGPETIIGKPDWHSPKIFRAARHALFTPTALAADPAVKALVAEAVAAERAKLQESGMAAVALLRHASDVASTPGYAAKLLQVAEQLADDLAEAAAIRGETP